MTTTIKLTEQELQTIQSLRTKYATITAQFGQVKIEQILANAQLIRLNELSDKFTADYTNIQTEETSFAAEITKKYGNGDINLESGEFMPNIDTV